MYRLFFLCVALLSSVAACTPPKVHLQADRQPIHPDDFDAAFKAWSRELVVVPINGMNNVLTARATYLSHEFRRTLAARIASDSGLTRTEASKIETDSLLAMERGHEFYITLMSAVSDCDELADGEGPWTIRLKNHRGEAVSPISIEEVEKPLPQDTRYYQFDPMLRKAYRIVFPIQGDDNTPIISSDTPFFELSFAGALGKDSARWEAI